MGTVHFATNRNPNRQNDPDDFGGQFNPDSADSLRIGRATVTRNKVRAIEVERENLTSKNPENIRFGSKRLFEELLGSMRGGTDTLAFIHGYNVSFEQALVAGARLQRAYAPANVVVFSWPSDGKMTPYLAYKRDRNDASASGPAFARALLKLHEFLLKVRRNTECKARIHLMAHSMGNYVLRHGLQEVRRHTGELPQLFDQIFLMAADEDHDAFEHDHKLRPLPEFGKSVNIYFNTGDTALVIADRTKSNPTRLGSRGPRLPLNVPGNVTIVDVSEVVGGAVEHGYFWNNPRTVSDVSSVLGGRAHDRITRRRYVPSQNRYVLRK